MERPPHDPHDGALADPEDEEHGGGGRVRSVRTPAGTDNFFALGASSLQTMAMVERLGTEFGVPVSIFAVTESPELAALAEHVTELLAEREQGEL